MDYAALPHTNPGLHQFEDQDSQNRDGRHYHDISPNLMRRFSNGSGRSSVSTAHEANAGAAPAPPQINLLQGSNPFGSQHALATGNSAHSTSGDATQTLLEMEDLNQSDSPKHSRPPASLFQLITIWRWELFTWILGTLGYLANLILVIIFNDKLQRDWHSSIQITAFVAALAQVSQSALLVPTASSIAQLKWKWISHVNRPAMSIQQFDLASRGPDGSLRLLWHFAWRQNLASLGAICTVLLLAFPTFVQQAVQIGTKDFESPGLEFASVRRATHYEMGSGDGGSKNAFFDQQGLGTWFTGNYMDVYLKSSMEIGLLADGISHDDVPSHCGSERCSWEPFRTLAVCSKVEDADHMLSFDQTPPRVLLGGDNITTAKNKFQAPGTFFARSKFFGADRYDATDKNLTRMVRSRATPNNSETNLPDLAQVYLTYFDPCIGTNDVGERESREGWKAHKATFSLCVQTHNVSYNASGLHTAIIPDPVDLKWVNETIVTDEKSSTRFTQYCTDIPSSKERFCISDANLLVIGGQLAITMDIGAYWGGRGDHYYVYSNWAPNLGRDVLGSDPGVCSTDDNHGIKGYEKRINSIAASVSNYFRTANSSTTVPGIAYTSEQTIQVNFYWLIFPSLLYIMITGFFVATVIQTRNLPPWKSSALALLWCTETGDNQLSAVKQMEGRGKRTKVQLLDEGDTWRVKES